MSNRHMEKAREIAAKGLIQNVKQWQDSIATVLAEEREAGRREGMRRAAEIAEASDAWPQEGAHIAATILAEAGIAVTD